MIGIPHIAVIQVVDEDSLLQKTVTANETWAFSVIGNLQLESGVYTLQALGGKSGSIAVTPLMVE